LSSAPGNASQVLKIAGRSFEGEKHGRGTAGELFGAEVVELQERYARAVRPHDEIAPLPRRSVELGRHAAAEVGQAHAFIVAARIAGAVRPRHVEAVGADTGESVEHRLRGGVWCAVGVLAHKVASSPCWPIDPPA